MSYTTQLAALAAAAASRLKSNVAPSIESSLRGISRSLEKTLACESRVRRLATRIARGARVTFLGSDLDEITALEAALKIRETCSLPACGYHVEQFLHGPYLSIDDRESIIMLRSRDDGPRSLAIARALKASGAPVATIARLRGRSEEHTSELQSPCNLVCRLLLEKKKQKTQDHDPSRLLHPHDRACH